MGASAFPDVTSSKNLPADLREAGSIPGSGRSPGREHGNQLQHFCLENPMERAAWPGCSPWDRKELYTTEEAEHTHMHGCIKKCPLFSILQSS